MKGCAYLFKIFQPFSNNVGLLERCLEFSLYGNLGMYSSAGVYGNRLFSKIAAPVQNGLEEVKGAQTAEEVLRNWGCDDQMVRKIFERNPPLRKALPKRLESKLNVLSKFGIVSTDLVKMVHHRPRFLSCRINENFEERLQQLQSLFGAQEIVLKAIVRNPSFLLYKFQEEVEPVLSLYKRLGIVKDDIISMLLHRPTLIARTNICEDKLDYIHRTGVTKKSKMYKYVVSIIGVSRTETLREKVANIEKFGFSEDEVLQLFGRSPLLMTLSVDKVQRNMTFVIGKMKLPANTVVNYPFLLYCNLENTLKPRVLLADKIQDMGLEPKIEGSAMFTALRMTEKRFLNAFVNCHEKDLRKELLDDYKASKGIKRLAASSKKSSHTVGFPF